MNNKQFFSLAPKLLYKNEEAYNKLLDFAVMDNNEESWNIKNIAISGVYGSGKSTVWKTYVKNNNIEDKIITVTLGKYLDTENSEKNKFSNLSNLTENKNYENRIERQIINQILSQVKKSRIPLTKYVFKVNRSTISILWWISLILIFLTSVVLLVNTKRFGSSEKEQNVMFYSSLFFMCFSITWWLAIIVKNNVFSLKKIKTKWFETDVETSSSIQETILEKDIKEIAYIVRSSGAKIIVFEDLDRFDDVELFSKLKELNFIINAFNESQFKKRKNIQVIKFVYMVRDEIFDSDSRTKFFDIIIPILPIRKSTNVIESILSPIKEDFKESENVLKWIINYIQNPRTLKNIVNEYQIIKEIIFQNKENMKCKKMLALIAIKNAVPKEFGLMQVNKGFIFSIFDKKEELKNATLDKLKTNLQQLNCILNNGYEKELEYKSIETLLNYKGSLKINEPKENQMEKLLSASQNEQEMINISILRWKRTKSE
ncbi:hypothetical protein V2P22_02865 [Mycoplasma capricolum subsp. capricolum]|uniref:YobI family P-loop NTPase n=1 Tax=Mycoplasma capricolum TaxID=2095 RepID=UPI003DA4AE73